MNKLNYLIIFWLCGMAVQAQTITQAEYFFDVDPGPGNATPVAGFSADDTVTFPVNISVTGLSLGFHFIAVRVKDNLDRWSHFEKRGFYIQAASVAVPDLVAAEYFFDQDPGPGNATPVSIGMTNDSISFMAIIPQSLPGGFHTLAVRVKDQNGRWSFFEKRTFYVTPALVSMPDIAAAEYFIGADPGVGNGIPIATGSPDDTITQPLTIPIPPSTPLGTYLYTTRVKDVTGKWSHYNYDTVFVAITVPEDTVLNATLGLCTKVVNGIDAQVINSEPYSYSLTGATTGSGSGSASGLSFNAGITTITYTLDDFPTAFASFSVTVVDTEMPTITCPANITVGADAGVCGAIVNYTVTFDDNCPGDILTLLSGLASGSIFPAGPTTNTFRVTDTSGNSMTCSFTITVVDDVPPVLICPANVTANTDSGLCTASNVSLGSPGVSDNCGSGSTSNNGLTVYPLGVTQVTWTSTDINGNTTTCIQTVTVVDNQNPAITCPANITMNADPGTCTKTVTYAASAMDNCGVSGIAYNPVSGSIFSVGTTVVTATATDVNGRTSSCTFTVTIVDSEDPVITCPANITVSADFGMCTDNVSYGASATDNCGTPTISLNPVNGSALPVGTTIVTATATDGGGRTATCTFSVTVLDDQPPSISCPANITVNTDSGVCSTSSVSLGSPVVSDNCGIAMTSNNGLSIYPVGITNILWTTTDVHGLTATCMQTVTVVDTEPPVIIDCPQNIVTTTDPGECAAVVNFSFAGTDQCGLQSIVSTTFQSGEEIPVGLHTIMILATDVNGNTSTCTFTVEITDDESPQITCPVQINDSTDPGACTAIVNFTITATDNCTITPSIISIPASGSAFPVGTTVVTSTATDMSGNSQSCTFVVIIEDEQPPSIGCPASITVNTDLDQCTASVALGSPITDDNCGVASTTNNAPVHFPKGIHNVIWTTTDLHGNTATCVQTVTVIDNEPPLITCPSNLNVFGGPGAGPVVVNYPLPTFSDNCPGASIFQTTGLPSGSVFPLGTTTNTFIVTDDVGMSASCSFVVTVRLGRVGVNTTNPMAMLHVADSSVLFTGPSVLPEDPAPPPINGPGIRMMWYPEKSALRMGRIPGTQWDMDSIGIISFAAGDNVKAIGDTSIALGANHNVSGEGAVAIGSNHNVSGNRALALGASHNVTGHGATALNWNNYAVGNISTASGFLNTSSGAQSFVMGYSNSALGASSIVAGKENIGNAFASVSIGSSSDTMVASRTNWIDTDHLFVVGNGLFPMRNNALTVLKNGNTGLNTLNPTFRFHCVGKSGGDGTFTNGILIENTNLTTGEAALSFRNSAMPLNRKWIMGTNQQPSLAIAYGSLFSNPTSILFIDTLGLIGIQTPSPQSPLHVVTNNPSGGSFITNPLAIFESNHITYLQLSHLTVQETGIISGNQSTTHRSGVIFRADSSLQFIAGGDFDIPRMKIAKNGNVGINTATPSSRMEVNGNVQLGVGGNAFQEIIKATTNLDVPSIANNGTYTATVTITGVSTGSSVIVSPAGLLPDGLIISSARVSSATMLEIRFVNKSGVAVDPVLMDYYFSVIR